MTTNFDLHKKGNKHSMQSKPQDLCRNRKTGGTWEEEKRGNENENLEVVGCRYPSQKKVITQVWNAENAPCIQFRRPAKLETIWALTINKKIIYESVLISIKGLELGQGGKAFLYERMPANVQEMIKPEYYCFVTTNVIINSVKAQWMLTFRRKLERKQYSWSFKPSLRKGTVFSLQKSDRHHLPQVVWEWGLPIGCPKFTSSTEPSCPKWLTWI